MPLRLPSGTHSAHNRIQRIIVVVQKLHSLFNQAEAKGDAAVLTCGAWSGIHPAFIGVPLSCDLRVPVFLAYPRNPRPEVQRFVRAVRSLVR